MLDAEKEKNENSENNFSKKDSKNQYKSCDLIQNQIKKNFRKNRNKQSEGSQKLNIYSGEINSIKHSISISSSKDESSKKHMNININQVSKYKRDKKSNINEMLSPNISIKPHKSINESINSNNYDNKEKNKEEEEENLTCRQRLTRFLETSNRLFYIKITIYILSILSFLYYILCTYINRLFPSLDYIDYIICLLYIIEHLFNMIMSHHLFTYLISIDSLISFLVEIPPYFVFLCENYTIDLIYRTINMTRVLRLLKAYKMIELFQGEEKSVFSQIVYIIITLIIMVLIWAGIIQMSDLGEVTRRLDITYKPLSRHDLLLRRQFHHYIYFSLVSLTTVGYGEIIPYTFLGKFMIVLMVVIILVVVPEQTNEIINLSNAQTEYERRNYISSPDIPYVVILGDIDLESLKVFCKEFFHRDHGENYRHIVILMNKYPCKSIELFLNRRNNSKFIIYLQGDPMNKDDLLRADILNARSCIIFTNKNSLNQRNGDQNGLLLAIFIKKFYYHAVLENYFKENKLNALTTKRELRKKINFIFKKIKHYYFRLCLQLNKPESCNHYYSILQNNYQRNMISDKLLVIESLKINLLSKSCITPGIISLISNLIISSAFDKGELFKTEEDWIKEYKEGQQYEIYKYKNIHGDLLFYNFQTLAQEIYNKFHSIVIALEINYRGGMSVKLNPQTKEKIINIIYYSFFMESKRNTLNEDINNKDEQASSSLLDEYNKESEIETDENYMKMNIDFKKIKISIYCISSNREIINNIKKLDEGKKFNVQNNNKHAANSNKNLGHIFNYKNLFRQQSYNFNFNLKFGKSKSSLNKKNLNYQFNKLQNNTIQNMSSDDNSDSSDEIERKDSGDALINSEKINHFYEDDLSKNYYILNEYENNYVFTNEITRQGISDRNDINHHIVICGIHQELVNFILPLRNKYLPERLLKWIVILSPFLPQEIHETLCKFPKIIYIKGDPLDPDNLFRVNIASADIAVILSSTTFTFNLYQHENNINENIEKNNEIDNNKKEANNGKDLNEEIIDAKTLFVYRAIKNINKNIQIITELLRTNDIEFLLTSEYLKKLYKYSNRRKEIYENNQSHINDENEESNKENLLYELTPVFAAGQVYLPSLVDKITAQLFYNSNLLTIINLLLVGEKTPDKKPDQKLEKMINFKGANLFLIPSEPKNESFGDMFNRLLLKYNMISIALYRKNVSENFYYVYINPRETTLIRDTDMIFVLSSTENIKIIYEKNFEEVLFSENIPPNPKENNNSKFFSSLMNSVLTQIQRNNINENNEINKNEEFSEKSSKEGDGSSINLYKYQKRKKFSLFKKNQIKEKEEKKEKEEENEKKNIKNGKFIEIDKMQKKMDKMINILKSINDKSLDMKNKVDNDVKEELVNEILFYISRVDKNK